MELAEIQDQQLMELPLFDQIDRNDIRPMLTCLGAFVREYRRNEYAVLDDELMAHVCVLMSGCIFMLKEDQEGHRSFLTYIQPGELFGESFALRHSPVTSVSFLTARPSQVLCLPLAKTLHTCSNRCVFHETLVSNLYEMLSRKNLALMQKIDILSRDTLRDKLLSFLRLQLTGDSKAGASRGLSIQGSTVTLPMNKSELANYLNVNRTSLCRELHAMEQDGLLLVRGDSYTLTECVMQAQPSGPVDERNPQGGKPLQKASAGCRSAGAAQKPQIDKAQRDLHSG